MQRWHETLLAVTRAPRTSGSAFPFVLERLSNTPTRLQSRPILSRHTAQIGLAWRSRLKACRRVLQAREHEGNGSATGTADVGDPQERTMPQQNPHQATHAVRVSVPPSLAHNSLTRLVWTWHFYSRTKPRMQSE